MFGARDLGCTNSARLVSRCCKQLVGAQIMSMDRARRGHDDGDDDVNKLQLKERTVKALDLVATDDGLVGDIDTMRKALLSVCGDPLRVEELRQDVVEFMVSLIKLVNDLHNDALDDWMKEGEDARNAATRAVPADDAQRAHLAENLARCLQRFEAELKKASEPGSPSPSQGDVLAAMALEVVSTLAGRSKNYIGT